MSKRILYCADGTWNDAATNTNVYKIFKAMNFTAEQCPIYDDGVGSDGNPLWRMAGGAMGFGLEKKLQDGYTRISHLYEKDDQLFLFGFSRGAFTARSLAGMIAVCGLPTQNVDDSLVALALDAYHERDQNTRKQKLQALSQQYAMYDAPITMVGVWDTVGALGVPAIIGGVDSAKYGFLDTSLHPDVKHAYHAVSIDERRAEFPATLWSGPAVPGQVIEQVYFTGVHCDVGGGYPECGLSDITLGWMMGKAKALGVDFDNAVFQQYATLDPKHALDQKHESWGIKWSFPKSRSIASDAAISNSAQIRLQCDMSYKPVNLQVSGGRLAPSHTVVPVIGAVGQAAAASGGSGTQTP